MMRTHPSGVVRGYDAVTGEWVWARDLRNPPNRGAPPEGEVYTRRTPNMWTIHPRYRHPDRRNGLDR